MLVRIRQLFADFIESAPDGPGHQHAIELAAAVLMLEIARADRKIGDQEWQAVTAVLDRTFSLTAEELAAVTELAAATTEDAEDMHQFTRLVNNTFTPEDKVTLIEDLWRVAYADGVLDNLEEHLVRKIAGLLHVPHSAFIRAKHQARG